MKKILLSSLLCCGFSVVSQNSFALDCQALAEQASQRSAMYSPRVSMQVVGQKGYRSHFYSAPSESCKYSNLFLIPNDSVIAYDEVTMGGQSWVSVMYVRKGGDTVEGWMKRKDFKVTGRIGF